MHICCKAYSILYRRSLDFSNMKKCKSKNQHGGYRRGDKKPIFFLQIETKDKIVYTQKAYISFFLNAVDNNVDLSNHSTLSPLNLQNLYKKGLKRIFSTYNRRTKLFLGKMFLKTWGVQKLNEVNCGWPDFLWSTCINYIDNLKTIV